MGKFNKQLWQHFWFILPLAIITLMFSQAPTIKADQNVESMKIDVALNDQGTASFTENWVVDADEGSEIYKTIKRQKGQKLSDYHVSMDGESFQREADWDTEGDRASKAYAYGQNGDELNWGITKYGKHHYKIKYRISNFVEQTKTKQMIAWQFVDKDVEIAPQDIQIKIHDPSQKFAAKNGYGIWGFGFEGKTSFNNGQILVKNDKQIKDDNRVKIIMKIPRHTYPTANTSKRSFDSYMKEAFKGSDFNYDKYKTGETQKDTSYDWLWNLGYVAVFFVVFYFSMRRYGRNKNYHRYYPKLKKLQTDTKGEYVREIPTDNDIFAGYSFVASLFSDFELAENYLSVSILSLVKADLLELQDDDEQLTLVLKADDVSDKVPNGLAKLYSMMQAAAEDNQVTATDLSSYFDKNKKDYFKIWAICTIDSNEYGEQRDLIYPKDEYQTNDAKETKANAYAQKHNGSALTKEGLAVRADFVRLKNYLEDFTLLEERTPKEVGLWDNLMLAATALGIAEEVANALDEVYPEYRDESIYYQTTAYPFYSTYGFATDSMEMFIDSGNGGSTSSGGGGSFGGSSGGGGFR